MIKNIPWLTNSDTNTQFLTHVSLLLRYMMLEYFQPQCSDERRIQAFLNEQEGISMNSER